MNRNNLDDLFLVDFCILLFQVGLLLILLIKPDIFNFHLKKSRVFLIILILTVLPTLYFEVEWTFNGEDKGGFISGKMFGFLFSLTNVVNGILIGLFTILTRLLKLNR
ncbi:MAG: hypothetical protein JWQ25_116 [Daejeonella sp.]|nr:hypothetical protein [Daejeonella sp.]